MSDKITSNEKLEFLYYKSQNLAITDLDANLQKDIFLENKNYIFSESVLAESIPSIADINVDASSSTFKLSQNDLFNYQDSISLKKDTNNIVLKVTQLKLQKIPNSDTGWYYLDASKNNFLTPLIPPNYKSSDNGSNTPFQVKIYSEKGLERVKNKTSILTNELLRSCDYIFDYENGILLLAKDCKDANGDPISTDNPHNPPYISFYKYIGARGKGNTLDGQWIKENNDIYYDSGAVIIGYNQSFSSDSNDYNLEISGNVYISNNLCVKGDQIVRDDHHVINNMDISGNLTVEGKSFFKNDVSGNDATFKKITIDGDFIVEGKTTIKDISGADASFNNIDIDDNLTVNGKTVITDISGADASFNNVEINSNLSVEGKSFFKNDVSGNDATFKKITIDGDFNVDGKTTIKDISGADASFNNVDINSNLTVDGKSIFKDVSGNDATFNNVEINSNLTVDGKTTIKDISGADASFNKVSIKNLVLNNISNQKRIIKVTAEGGKFYFDGISNPKLYLVPGIKYQFNQEDSSNRNHPLKFSTKNDNQPKNRYNPSEFFSSEGNAGQPGSYSAINVSEDIKGKFYYVCGNHSNMGNEVYVLNSRNINDASFNNIYIDGNLTVDGKTTIKDLSGADASFNNIDIDGNLTVDGKTTIKDISGADASFNNIDIDGNLTVDGKSTIKDISGADASFNNVDIDGDFIVEGKTTIKDISGADASFNNVDIDGDFIVEGKTTIKDISGADASFNNIDIDGNLTVDGKSIFKDVSGHDATFNKITIDGDFIVEGKTTIKDLSGADASFNNVDIDGDFIVKGKMTIKDISGADASFNNIDIDGYLTVDGKTTIKDLSGADASFNNIDIDGYLTVDGKSTFQDVSGNDASFNNVNIDGNLTVDGKSVLKDVSGNDASFNNIDVCGNKLNAKNIYITGNLYQNGNIFSTTKAVNDIGQSFFEIITQQPSKFNQGNISKSSTEINLSWDYHNILAKFPNTNLAKLSFQSATNLQNLPHISQIQFDISGVIDSSSGLSPGLSKTWIDYHTITMGNSDDYTSQEYKNITIHKTSDADKNNSNKLNILSKQNPFDIRIYGINNAVDYPRIIDRALVFKNLAFTEGKVPAKPIFVRENAILLDDQLSYVYKVEETENGNSSSNAVIVSAISEASQNTTLSSSIYPLDPSVLRTVKSLSNIGNDTNFDLSLTNLRAGTTYNYKVQVKNNIKDGYSEFSNQRESEFLRLPRDNGYSSTSVTLGINNNVSVSSPTLDGSNGSSVVYINSASPLYNLNPSKTSNQTIQITKPYGNTQQSETAGYGKWVDNKQDLVKVECYVDDNLKQYIAFQGFNKTNSNAGTATRHNRNSNSYNFFDSPNQQDIWSTQARRGFRIRGTFSLNSVSRLNVLKHIGAAQSTPHTIEYKYIRHSDVGGSEETNLVNVYIDTLSSDPTSTNSTTTTTVQSVIYTMGIPSVKTVNIDFERTYNNINSTHLYIRGDRKIARVSDITKINKSTDKYIYLARTNSSISDINNKAIDITGSYTYSSSDFATATNNYYHSAYYDESVGVENENGTTLTSSEQLYSLRGSFNLNKTFTVDHHFDRDSYNNYGGNTINRKLSSTDFYEISDSTNNTNIAKLGSDVGGIQVSQYTTSNTDSGHQKIPQDWTLLYYKGAFRTNASTKYPDVNNYEWNSVVTTGSQYNAGTKSYNLSGAFTTDDSGYKWIVFKLSMNDKSNTNINGIITYYYDVYTYLITKGFSNQTVKKIGDLSDNDVVAFVKQTVNNGVRIGNLGRPVNNMNLWYDQLSNVSYDHMVNSSSKNSYGCRYPTTSTSTWGPLLNTDKGDDVIYLFLGLKNNVSMK